MKDPTTLEILGNGKQRKSYLHVSDLIQAVLFLKDRHRRGYDYFNVGNEDWITVDEIASIVEEEMGLRPVHVYRDADNGRGWKET